MIVGAIYIIIAMSVGFGVGFAIAQIGRSQPATQTDLQIVLDQKVQELVEHKQEVANHFIETSNLIRNMTDSYRGVLEHLNRGAETLVGEYVSGNFLEPASHTSLLERQQSPEDTAPYLASKTAAGSPIALESTEGVDSTATLSKAAAPVTTTDLGDVLAAKQATTEAQTLHDNAEQAQVRQALASTTNDPVVTDETRVQPVPQARDIVDNELHHADGGKNTSGVEQEKDEVLSASQIVARDDVVKQSDAEKANAEQAELVEPIPTIQREVEMVAKTETAESKVDDATNIEETLSSVVGDKLAVAKVIVDHQDDPANVSTSDKNEAEEETKVWRREDGTERSSPVNNSMASSKSSANVTPFQV